MTERLCLRVWAVGPLNSTRTRELVYIYLGERTDGPTLQSKLCRHWHAGLGITYQSQHDVKARRREKARIIRVGYLPDLRSQDVFSRLLRVF